jgi:hypothetical protein
MFRVTCDLGRARVGVWEDLPGIFKYFLDAGVPLPQSRLVLPTVTKGPPLVPVLHPGLKDPRFVSHH